jgi:mannosylfructose-phosphate synthase
MTAVEAMACGTPCVITVHGGLHETVDFGTHALFADPKSADEFAVALSIPLKYSRVRERLSLEGARFARRNFGWTGVAKRTRSVFEQYIGRYQEAEDPDADSA